MKKKLYTKKTVKLSDIRQPEPGDLHYQKVDQEMVRLIDDVGAGSRPSWRTTARVADIRVHDEANLARARAALVESPGLVASMRQILDDPGYGWLVYRGTDGALVMFDDYKSYAIAVDCGVKTVPVMVLGEAAPARPDIER